MNKPLFQSLYLPNASDQEKEMKPDFGQTMSAAFGLENDVVNVLDYISKPTFAPDPNFNFKATFNEMELPLEWMPMLASSQSIGEFHSQLGQIQKEYQQKAVLASSGWTGTVAALGAGMLSPTMFIPFAGQARGAKGFAEILALAAAGAGAQNGALFLNQKTRTEAEFYSGVAMDTLLMGLMGGAWLGMTGRARAKLANDIPYRNDVYDISEVPSDLPGNATSKQFDLNEEGTFPPQRAALAENEIRPVYSKEPDLASNALNARQVVAYKGDEIVGAVEGEVTGKTVKIYNSNVRQDLAGKRIGTSLYEEFIGKAMDEGLAVVSDDTVSGPAARVYASLEKLGYKIEKSTAVETKADGTLQTTDSSPVFKVVDRPINQPDMAPARGDEPIPGTRGADGQSVGAAVTRTRNTLGPKRARNRVAQAALDALGRMSPIYRMQNNPFFKSLRHNAFKLDMAGLQQAGLEKFEPSAVGGAVIERIKTYDAYIADLALSLDKNYYNYVYDGAKGYDFGSPAWTQIKSQLGKTPPGKMDWTSYKAAIFDATQTGEIPAELADSVAAFKAFFKNYTDRQKQYMEEFRAAGLEVKPLFKELEEGEFGKGIIDYATHIFDQNKLMSNISEFIDDFAGYNEASLVKSFEKARVIYNKRKQKLEFEQMIAGLDPDEISARLAETEGDIEFLEELPEMQAYRADRLAITRQAKDEGWPKEKLKEAMKDLDERQTDTTKSAQEDRKRLMGIAKAFKKYGGDSAERTTKLQEEIAKQDELISGMFRTELPKIAAADLSIGKIQAQGDKAMKTVETGIAKIVKELQKRSTRMSKLLMSKRANSATRAKVLEQLERTKVKHENLLSRLEAVKGQQVALDQRLSELQLLREDAIAEANLVVRSRASRLEELEEKVEATAAKLLTPEDRLRMRDQIDAELEKHAYDFQDKWEGKRGEQSGDVFGTEAPDFRQKAREMAVMLHQKLTGSEVELSPAYHTLRQDARGAELLRTLKIPYNIKQKWLIKDLELTSRGYDRVMAPDLELWRAFEGKPGGKGLLGEIEDEVVEHLNTINTARFVRLPKGWVDKAAKFSDKVQKRLTEVGDSSDIYLDQKNFSNEGGEGFIPLTDELRSQISQSVVDASRDATRDVDVAIQRLRQERGRPRDSRSMWWRSGRFIKNMNVMTMMGGVTPASIPDVARPIWAHGIKRSFGHGFKPFITRLSPEGKRFTVRSKDINRRCVLNIEPIMHGRAQGFFDLAEDSVGRTRLERAANVGAGKMGLIALYDFWTAGVKSLAGNITHGVFAEYIPAVAKAWRENPGGQMTGDLLSMQTYLRKVGLSDLDINRIALQMEAPDGVERFSNGGVLPNMDKWTDMSAYQAYQAAVLADVNKAIVTPGLERPNIVDENMAYSMLFQFKSFVFGANSRMAMSALQGNDPYLMQGIAFSIATGALSYYAYALAAGGRTLEEANEGNLDQWIWQAVKRSGILGAISLGTDVGERIPLITGDDTNTMFVKPSGLLGAFLGPTYSQFDKLAEVMTKMGSDDEKQLGRNMRNLRQVFVPLQNHFLFRQLFDRAGEAMYGAN